MRLCIHDIINIRQVTTKEFNSDGNVSYMTEIQITDSHGQFHDIWLFADDAKHLEIIEIE